MKNTNKSELPRTYTKDQLAEILQITTVSINRYIAKGLINKIVINGTIRFSQKEVDRLLGGE